MDGALIAQGARKEHVSTRIWSLSQASTASVHDGTCVWNEKQASLEHRQLSWSLQQIAPVHSLFADACSMVMQEQPSMRGAQSIDLHTHSCPAPGQPLGAQQMVCA